MAFLVIDIIHLLTDWTFLNVPSAISLMQVDFFLWKQLETVLARLHVALLNVFHARKYDLLKIDIQFL